MSLAKSGGKKKGVLPRPSLDELKKASEAKRERNTPIFEEYLDEITARIDAGKKPSELAAWLNTLGFEGDGATLNGLLRKVGLW